MTRKRFYPVHECRFNPGDFHLMGGAFHLSKGNANMRDVQTLAKEIDNYTLETSTQIDALRAHIRDTWTIREVLLFKSFTHGGTFSAPGGGWRIDYAGYVAATADGMRNLVRLFDSLHAEAWAYMGAVVYARMDSRTHKMELMAEADDLMDSTLVALIKALPEKGG